MDDYGYDNNDNYEYRGLDREEYIAPPRVRNYPEAKQRVTDNQGPYYKQNLPNKRLSSHPRGMQRPSGPPIKPKVPQPLGTNQEPAAPTTPKEDTPTSTENKQAPEEASTAPTTLSMIQQ